MKLECVAHCEIDKNASKFYNENNKGNYGKHYSDVSKINTREMADFNFGFFGFPCQSWSISGRRLGFEDPRGNIFYQIIRILRDKKPEYILLENVKGILSHKNEEGELSFAKMLLSLTEIGYDHIEYGTFNAKHFSAQNRERVFIFATRCIGRKPRFPIFPVRGEHEKNSNGERKILGENCSYAIDSCYHKGSNTLLKNRRQLVLMNKPVHSNNRVYSPEGLSPTLRDMSLGGNRQPYVGLREVRTEEAKQIRRNIKKSTGKDHSPRRGKEIVPREDNLVGTVQTSPTVDTTITDGLAVRRLTPLECWRLQFGKNADKAHKLCEDLGISATQRYRMAGNSVQVDCVVHVLSRILEALDDDRETLKFFDCFSGMGGFHEACNIINERNV